ncbi:Fe-S cluster assembly protein SufD [Biostraticola tofi]|uniref:Iron-regulated ABC transporter permease protein SufD n=1 Tax=Biostraticola tofi TaxID=466109 RepID=A0A4R3Z3V8_9GAMM|nr:Fe-S cluster assembly protein SufD [Biostraticola tofi]TCV99738.1 iron-regulated ABC transporter permease protein SufD [Biostraticola tofi]
MAGLPNNNNARALHQWHSLFESQRVSRSAQAYQHWQSVEQLGLPTRKHEHWKYTPLDSLVAHRFSFDAAKTVSAVDRDRLSLELDAVRLVFVDGRLIPSLSDADTGNWQVVVEDGANRTPLPEPIQGEIFLHLTESLSLETVVIELAAGKTADRPLYLLHLSSGSHDKQQLNTLHYRHHVKLASGASGQVIEHYASLSEDAHFTGARTTIAVGDNARLNHIKLSFENRNSYHFAHNDLIIARDALVRSGTFLLGPGLSRHQTSARLDGEGSDLSINSLLLPAGQDITDTRTYLEHNKGHCLSRQLHKVIAREKGKGVFNGLIKVAKHALKTDGQMTNNNLLMDRLSEVDTKPQLEIYADDVKCSHGATVGRIDDEQMFYLRSRGIRREDAQKMIIFAFAAEVTEAIGNDLVRDVVLERITGALKGVGE